MAEMLVDGDLYPRVRLLTNVDRAVLQRALHRPGRRVSATPFNLLSFRGNSSGSQQGHSAATPTLLCEWWVRYISKPGDVILDPTAGRDDRRRRLAERREYIGI